MASDPCPCGTAAEYLACCGRLHVGAGNAPTAERLMRSRYSAFTIGDADYLLRTWHPDTRPARLDLDSGLRWVQLEVLATTGGSAFATEGTVRFRAHYREGRKSGVLEENSRFAVVNRLWYYLDAVTPIREH